MTAVAPILQAFFTDRLISQRCASPHTIAGYRDTFRLLIGYAATKTGKKPFVLDIDDLDAPTITAFLDHLEHDRGNQPRTRNWRLAAIHSLFSYAALHHPEHAATIHRVLAKRPSVTSATWSTGSPRTKPTPCSPHPTAAPGPGGVTTPCSSSLSKPGYASPN